MTTLATRNDIARKSLGIGCMLVQTLGVNGLSVEAQSELREAVEKFNSFTEDNDPNGEHDFGSIQLGTEGTADYCKYFWKIDDYGDNFRENGATHRLVLTLMEASEY